MAEQKDEFAELQLNQDSKDRISDSARRNGPFTIEEYAWLNHIDVFDFRNINSPFWRLYWNTSAGGVIQVAGKPDIFMEPDCFYLIPANFCFSTYLVQPFSHVSIHFYFGDDVDITGTRVYKLPGDSISRLFISRFIESYEADAASLRNEFMVYAIVGYVFQIAGEELKIGRMPQNERIQACIVYIVKHLGSNLDNRRLATISGMAMNAFIRLFSKIMSESPQAFVRRKRVEYASRLLQSTSLTIKEIAQQLGFANQYHFSRVFKKLQHRYPADFRKGLRLPTIVTRRKNKKQS